jgi:hypothetical protein
VDALFLFIQSCGSQTVNASIRNSSEEKVAQAHVV